MTALDDHRLAGTREQIVICASRNLLRLRRSKSTYMTAVVVPSVFFLGFYAALAKRLGAQGVDYGQFLTPAIVVQSMFTVGIGSGYATAEDATSGMLARLRSMPVHPAAPVFGRAVADAVRSLGSVLVVLGLGAAFGFQFDDAAGAAGFLVLAAAFALTVSLGCSAAALRVSSPEALVSAITLPYLPVLMLSTAFVPVDLFPSWLEPVVAASPVSAVADALRALATGHLADGLVLRATVWLVVLAAASMVLVGRSGVRR